MTEQRITDISFFLYINHPFGEETNCARPGARGEAKITVWCGLRCVGGVGGGERHFWKQPVGLKPYRFISLESLLPRLIANNSHVALEGCKAAKNRQKRRIRDSKAWFGKGLLFAGEIREKNYRVPVQTERGRGQEGVGTDVRGTSKMAGLRIVYLNITYIWWFWR